MMSPKFIFVGERPSRKAAALKITWRDGRLAAKPLFEALRACNLDPAEQQFLNLFGEDPDCDAGTEEIARRARRILRLTQRGWVAVGMGRRVCRELERHQVPCLRIAHPATRGLLRRRDRYRAHIREALSVVTENQPL